ncbi:MAG TPA: protein-L-isoaspartate o-methyltransferase 1 [Thermomicrobiales bacterium]|nr:protein-L-isoaspartate o-methyltransferase 1 [Thermomicrobiales bacterium]
MADEGRESLTEAKATQLALEGVERAGGTREIYRHPRHPFSLQPAPVYEIDGYEVEVVHGEISSPAIVTVGGYVFEIHENDIELLIRPPAKR